MRPCYLRITTHLDPAEMSTTLRNSVQRVLETGVIVGAAGTRYLCLRLPGFTAQPRVEIRSPGRFNCVLRWYNPHRVAYLQDAAEVLRVTLALADPKLLMRMRDFDTGDWAAFIGTYIDRATMVKMFTPPKEEIERRMEVFKRELYALQHGHLIKLED